jgi:hypothetical protein
MYVGYLIYGQFVLLISVPLGQPLEAIVKTNRGTTALNRLDSNRRNHAVCAWRRTTADQNAYSLKCHQD